MAAGLATASAETFQLFLRHIRTLTVNDLRPSDDVAILLAVAEFRAGVPVAMMIQVLMGGCAWSSPAEQFCLSPSVATRRGPRRRLRAGSQRCAFRVDLTASAAGLPYLHLDHEQDLQVTCDMWKQAWRAGPRSP